ncbi:hypothetical protein [Niveibacterium sp.]|uniref:hypothetical protein n=1 Tax=Niveibacterium sp. TaxID=2017444 RepID=UPI0035B31EE9
MSMMNRFRTALLAATASLSLQSAYGAETVVLKGPVEIAPEAGASRQVLSECNLAASVEGAIRAALEQRNEALGKQASDGEAILTAQIVRINGMGGGGWTGPKSIAVRVALTGNGKSDVSVRISRATRNIMGMVSGTCPLLELAGRYVAEDVAKWLDAPSTAKLRSQVHAAESAPTTSEAASQ